jgi:hypothetical protein
MLPSLKFCSDFSWGSFDRRLATKVELLNEFSDELFTISFSEIGFGRVGNVVAVVGFGSSVDSLLLYSAEIRRTMLLEPEFETGVEVTTF